MQVRWAWIIGGPADQEHLSDGLCNCPCRVSRSVTLAGCEVGPFLLPRGPGVTSDTFSSSKVLRGEDGKRTKLETSVLTCLGFMRDRSSKLTLQFTGVGGIGVVLRSQ